MTQITKEMNIDGERVATVTFEGIFTEEKADQFIKMVGDITQRRNAGAMDIGLTVQYEKAGPLLAFRFIDPKKPSVSETMIRIIPAQGREEMFGHVLAMQVSSHMACPKKPTRTVRPRTPTA